MSPSLISAFFLSLLCSSTLVSADVQPFNNSQEYADGVYGNYTRQRYLSDPDVEGPVANILTPAQPGISPSKYVFWTPGGPHLAPARPTVLDHDISVVWQGQSYGPEAIGATVQSCNGSEYITTWTGNGHYGHKTGQWLVFNNKYEVVYNISAKGELEAAKADAHEMFLTPECTAIFTIYKARSYDLTAFDIADGYLLDSYFQEVDLATGELRFQWQASAHVNILDSFWPAKASDRGLTLDNGYDFFHINSIEKDYRGNYLVSGRHPNAIYYVSGVTGAIMWQVGGVKNDFKDLSGGKATDFAWQHHARWTDANLTTISFYDDKNAAWHEYNEEALSRGVVVSLDFAAKTVKLEHEFNATRLIHSVREGSMQVLNDSPEPGNALIGYGHESAWTEFAPDGRVVFDVAFSPLDKDRWAADNYRAIKVNFTGNPQQSPKLALGPQPSYTFNESISTYSVALHDENGTAYINDTAYFSWNGATELTFWVVLASNETANLTIADHFWSMVPKAGFETTVFVGSETKYVQAVAANGSDFVLGATSVLAMAGENPITSTFDTELASQHLQSMLKSSTSADIMSTLKDKWDTIREQTSSGNGRIIAGVVGLVFTLGLLAICIVPIAMRLRRQRGYMQPGGQMYEDEVRSYDDEHYLEKARGSGAGDDEERFNEATGYFDDPEKEDDGDLSTLSGGSTLCEHKNRNHSVITLDK